MDGLHAALFPCYLVSVQDCHDEGRIRLPSLSCMQRSRVNQNICFAAYGYDLSTLSSTATAPSCDPNCRSGEVVTVCHGRSHFLGVPFHHYLLLRFWKAGRRPQAPPKVVVFGVFNGTMQPLRDWFPGSATKAITRGETGNSSRRYLGL